MRRGFQRCALQHINRHARLAEGRHFRTTENQQPRTAEGRHSRTVEGRHSRNLLSGNPESPLGDGSRLSAISPPAPP